MRTVDRFGGTAAGVYTWEDGLVDEGTLRERMAPYLDALAPGQVGLTGTVPGLSWGEALNYFRT